MSGSTAILMRIVYIFCLRKFTEKAENKYSIDHTDPICPKL